MGCLSLRPAPDSANDEALKRNATIEKLSTSDKKNMARTMKILLLGACIDDSIPHKAPLIRILGAGESGKSTIIKQMRIIYSDGFSEDERRQTRAVVYSSIIVAFKVLLDIMSAKNIDFETTRARVI